jgi:transposase
MGEEKLDEEGTARLSSLLELGDPNGEVAIAYRIKERLRDFYATDEPDQARQLLEELQRHRVKRATPPEVQPFGRTLRTWFDKIAHFHLAK